MYAVHCKRWPLEVVGVNFAKSADSSAENINYVIPGWRVKSMLSTFKARLAESPCGGAGLSDCSLHCSAKVSTCASGGVPWHIGRLFCCWSSERFNCVSKGIRAFQQCVDGLWDSLLLFRAPRAHCILPDSSCCWISGWRWRRADAPAGARAERGRGHGERSRLH